MRTEIRIRMRVDGILHPVANIDKDRYRIFMGELSARANISTASTKPQSGICRGNSPRRRFASFEHPRRDGPDHVWSRRRSPSF